MPDRVERRRPERDLSEEVGGEQFQSVLVLKGLDPSGGAQLEGRDATACGQQGGTGLEVMPTATSSSLCFGTLRANMGDAL